MQTYNILYVTDELKKGYAGGTPTLVILKQVEGAKILPVATCNEALEIMGGMAAKKEQLHMVMTDMVLETGRAGELVLRAVKAFYPQAVRILHTGLDAGDIFPCPVATVPGNELGEIKVFRKPAATLCEIKQFVEKKIAEHREMCALPENPKKEIKLLTMVGSPRSGERKICKCTLEL